MQFTTQVVSMFMIAFLVTGCTPPVRFDARVVSPTDRIGVWSTWSEPIVDSGGVGTAGLANTLTDALLGTTSSLHKELYAVRIHELVVDRFIQQAPIVFSSPPVGIKASEIVMASDGKTRDLIATANKLGLGVYVHLNSSMRVLGKSINYTQSWQPQLKVTGEMVRASDGKVLWRTAVETGATNGTLLKELFEDCATKAVNLLIQDLRRRG